MSKVVCLFNHILCLESGYGLRTSSGYASRGYTGPKIKISMFVRFMGRFHRFLALLSMNPPCPEIVKCSKYSFRVMLVRSHAFRIVLSRPKIYESVVLTAFYLERLDNNIKAGTIERGHYLRRFHDAGIF